jgi:hypothetical protein
MSGDQYDFKVAEVDDGAYENVEVKYLDSETEVDDSDRTPTISVGDSADESGEETKYYPHNAVHHDSKSIDGNLSAPNPTVLSI